MKRSTQNWPPNTVEELARMLGVAPGELYALERKIKKRDRKRPAYFKKTYEKNGKVRTLLVPNRKLKRIQRKINEVLQGLPVFPAYLHGGLKRRWIMTNALPHLGKICVAKFDLKDFFPSVRPERVFAVFRNLGCSFRVARMLTHLTTYNYQLPQGAPTSTILAALVCLPMMERLQKLAVQHNFALTLYVDDLTLSGSAYLGKFRHTVERIVRLEGWKLNKAKTEICLKSQEIVVTGIRVDQGKPALSSDFIRGFEEVLASLQKGYQEDSLKKVRGKLAFAKRIDPKEASRLRKKARKSGSYL